MGRGFPVSFSMGCSPPLVGTETSAPDSAATNVDGSAHRRFFALSLHGSCRRVGINAWAFGRLGMALVSTGGCVMEFTCYLPARWSWPFPFRARWPSGRRQAPRRSAAWRSASPGSSNCFRWTGTVGQRSAERAAGGFCRLVSLSGPTRNRRRRIVVETPVFACALSLAGANGFQKRIALLWTNRIATLPRGGHSR